VKCKVKGAQINYLLRFSIARIQPNFKETLSDILYMLQVGSQKIHKDVQQILLSYLACSHIWLNLPMDDCHFGYITNLHATCK
jgi:hypothetical protein